MTDSRYQLYRKKALTEMRPYEPGESLAGVSVSPADTPSEGDMIARDPSNPADQWLVSQKYFENYELVPGSAEAVRISRSRMDQPKP